MWIGRQRELADYIENAAELVMEPREVFGTGRMLDPNNGVAFCKHERFIANDDGAHIR